MSRELMSAIKRGDAAEVQRLIPLEDITLIQDRGLSARCSPLKMDCFGYNIAIIQTLIDNGAYFTSESIVRILINMMNDFHSMRAQIIKMKIIKIMIEQGVRAEYFEEAFEITIPPYHEHQDMNPAEYLYHHIIMQLRNIDRFNIYPELDMQDFINHIDNYGIEENNIMMLQQVETQHNNSFIEENTTQETDFSNIIGSLGSISQQDI